MIVGATETSPSKAATRDEGFRASHVPDRRFQIIQKVDASRCHDRPCRMPALTVQQGEEGDPTVAQWHEYISDRTLRVADSV